MLCPVVGRTSVSIKMSVRPQGDYPVYQKQSRIQDSSRHTTIFRVLLHSPAPQTSSLSPNLVPNHISLRGGIKPSMPTHLFSPLPVPSPPQNYDIPCPHTP